MTDKTPPNMRVLKILEVISSSSKPLTPTEINLQLNWPKQSLHRLCQSLTQEGFLIKQGKRLFSSKRLTELCNGLSQHAVGSIVRHQIMINIARDSGETVNFVRPETRGMIYADRVESNWAFRVLLPIGTHVPFHCTASGKTFLASLPAAKRRNFLNCLELTRHTEKTLTDFVSLERELKKVSKYGFAIDEEEYHRDMVAIAVPVRDNKGRYIAALAIHGPKQRFPVETAIGRLDLLRASAIKISESFQLQGC